MNAAIRLSGPQDTASILSWNQNTPEFLRQWSDYTFPLDTAQLLGRVAEGRMYLFSVDGTPAGTFQFFQPRMTEGYAALGCVLLDPALRGRGFGKQMLRLAVEEGFRRFPVPRLELNVWADNTAALCTYRAVGFTIARAYLHDDREVFRMALPRPAL